MERPKYTLIVHISSTDGYISEQRLFFTQELKAKLALKTWSIHPLAQPTLRDFNDSDIPFLLGHVKELEEV